MKIAVLTEYYPTQDDPASGVYVHARVAAYRKVGVDARVYRSAAGPTARIEYDGVPLTAARPDDLRGEIERFAPAAVLVHTPHPYAPHTRIADSLPAPRVFWVHGYEAMLTALSAYHRGVQRALSLMHDVPKLWRLRRLLARAAAVVYVSAWMRSTAERATAFRHPEAHVIPNPVDTERFRPAEPPRVAARLKGLCLRPLSWPYGVDLVVRASAGCSDLDVTLVGVGPDGERLRRLIEQLHAPVSLEERPVPHAEMPSLLAAHDYFIAPDRKIPAQGVAMCEAMACGLPVVAVGAGGVPEFVVDGADGFLFRRYDVGALRRALLDLVADPEHARAMGRSARARVSERCSAERVIAAELELIARVTARARG